MERGADAGETERDSGMDFEHMHVQSVYDEIAPHFCDVRHKAWPNVKKFLKGLEAGALVADIGCGNGRYLNINKKTFKIGLDRCLPLVDIARTRGGEVAYGDNLQIPFRDEIFDAVVSVGVIHHFSSPERRAQAVVELTRILRPGGKLMIYVWSFEQKHRRFESQDVLVPWHGGHKDQKKSGLLSRSSFSSDRGFSSTSSLSEDDSTESCDQSDSLHKPMPSIEKSGSLRSLDSLPCDQDFENEANLGEAGRHRRTLSTDFGGCVNESRKSVLRSNSHLLVQECRKLEASLRALSADCLYSADTDRRDSLGHRDGLGKSAQYQFGEISDNDSEEITFSCPIAKDQGTNIFKGPKFGDERNDLSVIKVFDENIQININVDTGTDETRNKTQGNKENSDTSIGDRQSLHLYEEALKHKRAVSGVSLRRYCLDSCLRSPLSLQESESLDDDVFVDIDVQKGSDQSNIPKICPPVHQHKPVSISPSPSRKEGKESIFDMFKTKLFRLLDISVNSEKKVTNGGQTSENGKTDTLKGKKNSATVACTQTTNENKAKTLAKMEGIDFAVREFPMSSCPTFWQKSVKMKEKDKRGEERDFEENQHHDGIEPKSAHSHKKEKDTLLPEDSPSQMCAKYSINEGDSMNCEIMDRLNTGNCISPTSYNQGSNIHIHVAENGVSAASCIYSTSGHNYSHPTTESVHNSKCLNEVDDHGAVDAQHKEREIVYSCNGKGNGESNCNCAWSSDLKEFEISDGSDAVNKFYVRTSACKSDRKCAKQLQTSSENYNQFDLPVLENQSGYGLEMNGSTNAVLGVKGRRRENLIQCINESSWNVNLNKSHISKLGANNFLEEKDLSSDIKSSECSNSHQKGTTDKCSNFQNGHGSLVQTSVVVNGCVKTSDGSTENSVLPGACQSSQVGVRGMEESYVKTYRDRNRIETKPHVNDTCDINLTSGRCNHLARDKTNQQLTQDNNSSLDPSDKVFSEPKSAATTSDRSASTTKPCAQLCRFYHVFREGELEHLINTCVPGMKILHCFNDHSNWCVVAEKVVL